MRNKTMRALSSISLAAMLLIAAGCSSTSKDERSEGRTTDDKKITKTIEKDLMNDPTYKFTQVQVSTFGGVVQLGGFVNTQDEKDRAAQVAQNVDGVKQVVNSLTLKPMEPTGRSNSN